MELQTLFGRESAARTLLKNKALRIPLNQWRTLCSRSKTSSVKAGKLLPTFLCRFKNGGWLRRKRKFPIPPTRVLNVPNVFLVYLKCMFQSIPVP